MHCPLPEQISELKSCWQETFLIRILSLSPNVQVAKTLSGNWTKKATWPAGKNLEGTKTGKLVGEGVNSCPSEIPWQDKNWSSDTFATERACKEFDGGTRITLSFGCASKGHNWGIKLTVLGVPKHSRWVLHRFPSTADQLTKISLGARWYSVMFSWIQLLPLTRVHIITQTRRMSNHRNTHILRRIP